MNRKPLFVSFTLFVMVGALAFWLLSPQEETDPEFFFSLQRATPDTITVIYRPDTTVLVPGGETGWQILYPVADGADAVVVEGLVTRLRDLPSGPQYPLVPAKMDTYGMRHPRGAVFASYRGSAIGDTLWVGSLNVTGEAYYVRSGSIDEVALLSRQLVESFFLRGTIKFRRADLLPFHSSRAIWFETRGEGDRLLARLERGDSGKWVVVYPHRGPASKAKVEKYLETLSHLSIERFLVEDPLETEPYGLDGPQAGIRVGTSAGDTLDVALGGFAGLEQLYASIRGRRPIVGVSDKYLSVARWDPDALRDPTVLRLGLSEVDSISVFEDGIRRRGWTSEAWSGVEQRGSEVRAVLENWTKLQAERFFPATAANISSARLGSERLVWWSGADTLAVLARGPLLGEEVAVHIESGRDGRPQELLIVPGRQADLLWRFLTEGP